MKSISIRCTLLLTALCCSSLSLAACTSEQVTDSAHLLLESKMADAMLQSGTPADVVLTAQLSEQESLRIVSALDTYELVRLKWTEAPDSAGNAVAVLLSVCNDYSTLYGEYSAVKQIVQTHWSEYTPDQQELLRGYHERALRIHEAMRAITAEQHQVAQATSTLLSLGGLIAQTVAL